MIDSTGLSIVKFSVDTAVGKDGQPMNPGTKGSARAFRFGNRLVVTNDNQKNKLWASRVAWVAKAAAALKAPWEGAVELHVNFRVKRPKSLPKSRLGFAIAKPDLDKMMRSIKDALTDVIYKDDSQVVSMHSWKVYGDAPGIDVEVMALTNEEKGDMAHGS